MQKHRGRIYATVYRAAVLVAATVRLAMLWINRGVSALRRTPNPYSASVPKWNAILRWSLMLENWVLKY
jgi:hypothetical protein